MKRVQYNYKTKEIKCRVGTQEIYGVAYIPQTCSKIPLAIFAHELGATHRSGIPYAEALASCGIAAYTFDFRGGSASSRSDGDTDSMSVMTEADDICSVLDEASTWNFVDAEHIVLIGASHGGMASAIAASRRPNDLCALILLYPALVTYDAVHEKYKSIDEVPCSFWLGDLIHVGKHFVTDSWNYDVYADMSKFKKPVLILHGDKDKVVDLSYSERAAATYPDCDFHVMHNAGHEFSGENFEAAMGYIDSFLQERALT